MIIQLEIELTVHLFCLEPLLVVIKYNKYRMQKQNFENLPDFKWIFIEQNAASERIESTNLRVFRDFHFVNASTELF